MYTYIHMYLKRVLFDTHYIRFYYVLTLKMVLNYAETPVKHQVTCCSSEGAPIAILHEASSNHLIFLFTESHDSHLL